MTYKKSLEELQSQLKYGIVSLKRNEDKWKLQSQRLDHMENLQLMSPDHLYSVKLKQTEI